MAGTFHIGRIGDAPMCLDRLPRPNGTDLGGSIVADRDDEADRRGAGPGKLVPALRSIPFRRKPKPIQQSERSRMDFAFRIASRRKGSEAALTFFVEDRFGQNRTSRVSGAEK